MRKGIWLTHSAEETFELGYQLGEELSASTLILLAGNLGAGKTVFSKGLAAGLDIDPANVTSPTFTLVNEYTGRLNLVHLDLYRLPSGVESAYSLGLTEILASNAVTVIEWAEKLRGFPLPPGYHIQISYIGDQDRSIEITSV